jgi:adenylylsulfate kinase-like enzyme
VLITGVYGSGKSSVAEEMVAVLEEHNAPYALLDLDLLAWFDTGTRTDPRSTA